MKDVPDEAVRWEIEENCRENREIMAVGFSGRLEHRRAIQALAATARTNPFLDVGLSPRIG